MDKFYLVITLFFLILLLIGIVVVIFIIILSNNPQLNNNTVFQMQTTFSPNNYQCLSISPLGLNNCNSTNPSNIFVYSNGNLTQEIPTQGARVCLNISNDNIVVGNCEKTGPWIPIQQNTPSDYIFRSSEIHVNKCLSVSGSANDIVIGDCNSNKSLWKLLT